MAASTTTDGVHFTSQVTIPWSGLQKILTLAGVVNDGPQLLNISVELVNTFGTFVAPTTLRTSIPRQPPS